MATHEIAGLAVPFNVPNSYGEIIKPGAFDKFLNKNAGRPLPMLAQHSGRPVGYWKEFAPDAKGLWVRGVISMPEGLALQLARWYPELSITFWDTDNKDGELVKLTARRAEFIKEVNGVRSIPPYVHTFETVTTAEAGLAEISIVDEGAFPGTRYSFV